ncbi:hypothetical protein B6A27_11305 [Anoxybacillus sp. UARK-01]|uniref:ATP-binding protein n=1 Tax=Anoxybacillus sp. UARK-01 TaxID=1895648 RepID=UPI0009BB4765|nr:ATP-binding protein [Anoxybacillus sp. UARK-01]OQM45468.1 hypothetical protein B6A27_11305 [Anoxybacillus sp. UARK-01]
MIKITGKITENNYSKNMAAMLERLNQYIVLTEMEQYALQLVLWELISNVIRHSTVKKADVLIHLSTEDITIELIDHGNGFDWRSQITKAPPSLLAPHEGCGLFLIQQLATHVTFDDAGKKARVIIQRAKIEEEFR